MACVWAAALAGGAVPVQAGIVGPPAGPASHTLQWPALQALAGQRLRDPVPSRQLTPVLKKVLGARYADFMVALGEEAPMRVEAGKGLVGEGVVPNTLGYRGAFFLFDRDGAVFAVIKGGPHGSTIERFGSLAPLKTPELLHAYQEFAGIDE